MLKNQQIVVLARKRKSKIWRVRSHPNRAQVHARKEKARLGVCGAPPPPQQGTSTRQKRKSKIWRVRSNPQQGTGTRQKRKSKT